MLEVEKVLTRRSDELARRREVLPRLRVDKVYRFETDEGSVSLAELFRGRSQLLVYHSMFGPDFGPDYTAGSASRAPSERWASGQGCGWSRGQPGSVDASGFLRRARREPSRRSAIYRSTTDDPSTLPSMMSLACCFAILRATPKSEMESPRFRRKMRVSCEP